MKLADIKKIEEVLLLEKPLLRYKFSQLTANGENNGESHHDSVLLNVELRLKNEKNFEEKFEVFAKLADPNISAEKLESFKNEIAFYKFVIPELQDFLKLQNARTLDLFAKYYGGRMTFNSRVREADNNAIFFLENLKISGFLSIEPTIGFDLKTTKVILRELSKFHASFLAVRLKKPEIFKHKIRPHANIPVSNGNTDVTKIAIINNTKEVVQLMWENEACVSLIPRIRRAMSPTKLPLRDLFATIIHGDFWTNNVMVKLYGDEVKNVKFIDFQHYCYGSPAAELLFFLFTSVETSILELNFDELVKYYHETFVATLEDLNCDDVSRYSFDEFFKDVNSEAKYTQFPHIMMKLKTIFSDKYLQEQKERAWYIVQEFAKRNWL